MHVYANQFMWSGFMDLSPPPVLSTQVAMACEKQLAVQHKLAPVDVSRVQEGLNGWLTTVLALRIRHIQFTENFVFLLE